MLFSNTLSKFGLRPARPIMAATGLGIRAFDSYPAAAEYCRLRMAPLERKHFEYGTGSAFMQLLDFMAANAAGRVGLLVVGQPDPARRGELNGIKWVIAYREGTRSPLNLGRGTILLYGGRPETAEVAEA